MQFNTQHTEEEPKVLPLLSPKEKQFLDSLAAIITRDIMHPKHKHEKIDLKTSVLTFSKTLQ